jgi:hypothetical protein
MLSEFLFKDCVVEAVEVATELYQKSSKHPQITSSGNNKNKQYPAETS